jgi:hypothetical protein
MKTKQLHPCDLCSSGMASDDKLLCPTCAESIQRLMSVAEWQANRADHERGNQEQTSCLPAAVEATRRAGV